MVDPLGLRAHRQDRCRQRDVVVRLPAQRVHVRLLGEVAGHRRRGGRSGGRRPRSSAPTSRSSWASNDDIRCKIELTAIDIPDEPDRGRMYREIGARLRASMTDNGVDALVLLGNGNVVYATGASWPLLDAGLSHVERPVAIVLADDEYPHLYMPFREGSGLRDRDARRPRSRPALSRIRRGCRTFGADRRRPRSAGREGRGRRADRLRCAGRRPGSSRRVRRRTPRR